MLTVFLENPSRKRLWRFWNDYAPYEYGKVGTNRQEKTPAENGWGLSIGGAAATE